MPPLLAHANCKICVQIGVYAARDFFYHYGWLLLKNVAIGIYALVDYWVRGVRDRALDLLFAGLGSLVVKILCSEELDGA